MGESALGKRIVDTAKGIRFAVSVLIEQFESTFACLAPLREHQKIIPEMHFPPEIPR